MPVPAPLPLSSATLPALSGRLTTPQYDRTALTPAVVHLGVGGFHRAHQAVYFDDLAGLGETGWGEIGVSLRSPAMRDALEPQDGLFTVVERGTDGDRARVVGVMSRCLFAPDDPEAVLAVLSDARTRVVTLTITGGGYNLDENGAYRTDDETVQAELADRSRPSTAAGYLVEALARRRAAQLPAFTVLSCDNVPDNGPSTRTMVLSHALLLDAGLAEWIEAHASFPSSMVDRITPETDDALRELVAERWGVADRWPVVAEPFRQWVVEDDFCNGRPPLDRVGMQYVDDVTPYRLVKTRLLNASHSALGYVGVLAGGARTTTEAMANPVLADFVRTLMRDEIAPLLPEVPGLDLAGYQDTLLERFANPAISDQLGRLCGRGSTKMPAYLLPSLVEARRRGTPSRLLELAVAAWFCYLRGYDLDGNALDVKDARWEELRPLALQGGNDPAPLLSDPSLFGALADDEHLRTRLGWSMQDLEGYGAAATICDYLAAELHAAA